MRKTKSEGKTVGILIGLRNSQSVRNLFARLRILQCICEIGKVVENLAKWFANLAKWFANLAMRNFAKVLKFLCETNEQCMWLANFALPNSQCQQIANRLPTDCQFRNGCQLIAN